MMWDKYGTRVWMFYVIIEIAVKWWDSERANYCVFSS